MPDRPQQPVTTRFRLGNWTVEPSRNRISRGGESVSIENKAMDTLVYLAERAGEVVAADDIIAAVWGGQPMGDNPVYKSVAQLRKALGDDPKSPRYIETIARRGYRLVADVAPAAPAEIAGSAAPAPAARRTLWLALGVPLVAVALLLWLATNQQAPPADSGTDNSIAVLPFENLSGDPDNELFCRGIAEEILDHLAEIPTLTVMARQSAFSLFEPGTDFVEIASRLGVRYLLTGTVRQEGRLFRVSVRLVDADGAVVWSQFYDRDAGDVLTLQNDIAAAVVDGLALQVGESFHARRIPSDDFEAYTAFALGRDYLQRRPDNWAPLAAEAFEEAIRRDPEFADAYAALATAQLLVTRDPGADLSGPQALIEHALTLDPNLAEAHAAAGLLEMSLGISPDYDAAVGHLRRALQLNSSLVDARNWLSISLGMLGRHEEGIAVLNEAIAIDPLNATIRLNLGRRYHGLGQLRLARREMARVLEFPDAPGWTRGWLAEIEMEAGRYDAALDWLRPTVEVSALERSATRWEAGPVAVIYAQLGMFDEANRLLAEMRQPGDSLWSLYFHYRALMPQSGFTAFRERVERLAASHADEAAWPVWARLIVGGYRARAGDYRRAIDLLEPLLADGIPDYNGPGGATEIYEPVRLAAFAYRQTGRPGQASALLGKALERLAEMRRGKPRLLGSELVIAAGFEHLLGNRDVAVTHMQEAIESGWRGYYDIAADPSFAALLAEPALEAALERVRGDLELQRERVIATDRLKPILPAAVGSE